MQVNVKEHVVDVQVSHIRNNLSACLFNSPLLQVQSDTNTSSCPFNVLPMLSTGSLEGQVVCCYNGFDLRLKVIISLTDLCCLNSVCVTAQIPKWTRDKGLPLWGIWQRMLYLYVIYHKNLAMSCLRCSNTYLLGTASCSHEPSTRQKKTKNGMTVSLLYNQYRHVKCT